MERRVKERLIGASILVALIVWVVPELLSGPKPAARTPMPATLPATAPEPTRSVTVDLSTSKAPESPDIEAAPPTPAPAASPPAVAIYGPSSAAAPGATAPGATAPGALPPAPRATAPAPQAATPIESAATSPISSHAAWSVQLGSFANRPNADKLARQLKGQGFSVYVVSGGSGASVRYRVRIGPLADRASAERTVAKLKSIGHASSLVAPAR
jgi:DedD protein